MRDQREEPSDWLMQGGILSRVLGRGFLTSPSPSPPSISQVPPPSSLFSKYCTLHTNAFSGTCLYTAFSLNTVDRGASPTEAVASAFILADAGIAAL